MKENILRPPPTSQEIAAATLHNLVLAQFDLIEQRLAEREPSGKTSAPEGALWSRLKRLGSGSAEKRAKRELQETEQRVRNDHDAIEATVRMFREFAAVEQREIDRYRAMIGDGDVTWARAAFELRNETGMTLHQLKELDPSEFHRLVKKVAHQRSGTEPPQDSEQKGAGPSRQETDCFYAYFAAYKYLWQRTHTRPQPRDIYNVLRANKDLWPTGFKLPESKAAFQQNHQRAAKLFGASSK